MLSFGAHRAARVRLGCGGTGCLARRARRGLLQCYAPLRRKMFLEAKRSGRSTAAQDDSDDGIAPVRQSRGAADELADNLSYWEASVSDMSFRDVQVQLRNRGLNAGGRKDEVITRLAEALLQEHLSSSGRGEEESPEEEGAETQQQLLEAVLDRLHEIPYNDLRRLCSQRGLSVVGKKPDLQQRLAEAVVESQEDIEELLGGPPQEQQSDEEEESELGELPEEEGEETQQQLLEAVLDRLHEIPYNDLRRLCSQRGLSVVGKKPDLQQRLAEAVVESQEDIEELLGGPPQEQQSDEEEESELGSSPDGSTRDSDADMLLPELLPLKVSELVALLNDYGASTSGTQQELALRLAECMLADVKREISSESKDGGAQSSSEGEDEYEEEEEGASEIEEDEGGSEPEEEEALVVTPSFISPEDRKLLLADVSSRMYAEYLNMNRQQLFNALKELRRNPSYLSRAVLLDQLVRFQAEQQLEGTLQAALSDPEVASRLAKRLEALKSGAVPGTLIDEDGLAQSTTGSSSTETDGRGAIDYHQLTPLDVRRLRVDELRSSLRFFGMDSTGNKYDMQERLVAHVKLQSTNLRGRGRPPTRLGAGTSSGGVGATAASRGASADVQAEGRFAAVLGMSVRSLREELDARGLSTSGSRQELQSRLLVALRQDVVDARALSSDLQGQFSAEAGGLADDAISEEEVVARRLVELAELPLEERGAAVVAALMEDPQRLITLGHEAPVDLAVVAGCPPGRLDLAQRSLDAARTLLDQLYTAHMPSPMDRVFQPTGLPNNADGGESGEVDEKEIVPQEQTDGGAPALAAEIEGRPELDATLSHAPAAGGVARPSHGVIVAVWWLDGNTGQLTRLSPAQVYAATATELVAGCLPAVHRELLAVPPPSPLSLDIPELDGPVPAAVAMPLEAASSSPSDDAVNVAAKDSNSGGPVFFADLRSLAAHLREAAHVVFPALPAGSPLYGELQRALKVEGVPHVGSCADVAALAHDRLGVLQRLESLSYPVVPQLELGMADVAEAVRQAASQSPVAKVVQTSEGADVGGEDDEEQDDEEQEEENAAICAAFEVVRTKLDAWCQQQGFNPERQLFLIRPRHALSGHSSTDVDTALGVGRVAALLAGPLAESVLEVEATTTQGRGGDSEAAFSAVAGASTVVVEPSYFASSEPTASSSPPLTSSQPSSMVRFVCTVVETPDGPVALLPSEVEMYDTEMQIMKHEADVAEWLAMREGTADEKVAEVRADTLAVEPEAWRAVFDPWVTLPATTSARLHTPPRMSRKLTHAIRHSAARLFIELGLQDFATVEGWVELPVGYVEALEEAAGGKGEEMDDVPTLYDPDPYILSRIAQQEVDRILSDPAPLEAYYDYGTSWHADLSSFEPALRLNGASNGEGATVRISSVTADLPLDPRHPAVLQAVEVGLPHAALLRNLANNALRRAAAAGDRRALVPGEPYTSPPEAVEAAAVEAILDVGTADMPPPAEEWASTMTEVFGEGEEEEDDEEVTLQPMSLEEEEEEWQAMEDREGAAAAAAVAAAAEPVPVGPEPLQLPMPPQLPLYHTAVLQHLREADEYDTWVEEMDPDHWEDTDGPERVQMMAEEMEEQLEEVTGVPRGHGDNPNPVATDMVAALAMEGHRQALDAAVDALGDFGSSLSEMMSAQPLDEAAEADAEIPLTRVYELPHPNERLPDGVDGTAADPRVVAAWQMAAICELARRHGWEVLEVADAEEEAAELAAAREAEGISPPTPEEEEAAAAAAEEEQTVLEGMCASDDEVMELRTGLITPVQLYLRFRERQARKPPTSHPLLLAAETVRSSDLVSDTSVVGSELEELGEDEDNMDESGGERLAITALNPSEELGEDEEAAGGLTVFLPRAEGEPEPEPGSEEEKAMAVASSFGSASSGFGMEGPSAYTWNLPPDDAVELPVYASAGLTAAAMAVQAVVDSNEGSLAKQVVASVRQKLDSQELEALALMEMGYEITPMDRDLETGLPLLAAIGPSLDGLHQDIILDPFGGGLAQLPTFFPLNEIKSASTLEPGTSAAGEVDWDDDDGFARGVARAAAATSQYDRVGHIGASASDDDDVEEEENDEEEEEEEEAVVAPDEMDADGDEVGMDDEAAEDEAADMDDDEEDEDVDPSMYPNPTVPLVAEALERGDVEAAELAALVPPMNPTRVWVVVGGDGHWGREGGLRAGANIISKLMKYQDLVVEPFLMVPMGEGRNTDLRRAELLRRRTEYIAGLDMDPEEDLPESMSLEQLRVTPPMVTGRPETQCIYAVTMATVSRPSVPEALASLERTAAREGVALHSLTEVQRQQRAAHCDVQAELAAAGMEGVASLWDDNFLGQPGPPPARPLDLESFAEDAKRAGAVVLVAARGEMAECGHLQALLELEGVACVGPGSQQLSWLWNRTEASEMLQELHDQGVDAPPRFFLEYDNAVTAADLDEREADELMGRLLSEVVEGPEPPEGFVLLVRPVADVAGTGVARLSCGADIVLYMTAMRDGAATLPAGSLSYPHGDILMPPVPPPVLSFELFVETDPLFMVLASPTDDAVIEAEQTKLAKTRGSGKGKTTARVADVGPAASAGLYCSREKGWVEVSFTLMGPLGAMSCLPPAMKAAVVSESDLAEADEADEQVAKDVEAARTAAAAAEAEHEQATAVVAAEVGEDEDDDDEVEEDEETEAMRAASLAKSRAQATALALQELPSKGINTAVLLAQSPSTWVVPPPEEALSTMALDEACKRAALIADRMGLRGMVQIEAFVASDSGELAVYDINGNPDLGPDSPIWRQAAAAGLLPQNFLRELIGLALGAASSPEGRRATMEAQMETMEREGWDLQDDEAYDGQYVTDDEGELGLGGDGDEEDVESEGGRSGLADGEDDDMLGQLEEMRDEEDEGAVKDEGLGAGVVGMRGRADDSFGGDEGFLYFDDEEDVGGQPALNASSEGFMGFDEFSEGSSRGRR